MIDSKQDEAVKLEACPSLTLEDARQWRMRERAHFNGGKDWFGYEYSCIEQPRLRRMDRYLRKDRSVQSTWKVDGQEVESLEAAIAALNCPATFTSEEQEALRGMSPEWADLREVLSYQLLHALSAKGAIIVEHGRSKPTEAGRSA